MSAASARSLAPALALALALGAACGAIDLGEEPTWPRPEAGAVASEHPLATAVGLAVLDEGGNAADAAVAAALALAVVYPEAGNLGGGGFALFVPHGGEPSFVDFREEASARADPSLYLDERGEVVPERSLRTALAVGVPGSPAGLLELHQRFGSRTMSFARLAAPAIELARQGFEVDAWLAARLAEEGTRAKLEADPAARARFYPGGAPLAEGDRLVQPELARTLVRLARQGRDGFYKGEVAQAIVRALAAADLRTGSVAGGAFVSTADLAAYRVLHRDPVVGWFRGAQIISSGPPSSGGVALLQLLGILEGFPLDAERSDTLEARALGIAAPSDASDASGLSARAVHWWIEALRAAFADRAVHLGDPDYYSVPLERLLSPDWLARRRVAIGPRAAPELAPMPLLAPESSETTHLSVIDREGNAVSLTTTLNASFGSGILVPEGGFLLNNQLDDFSILPGTPNLYGLVGGAANQLLAGKRPLSSMAPTVVREGGRRVTAVLGARGGPRIISAVAQVLLRWMVYGQDIEAAVRAPRVHQQWQPSSTRVEEGFAREIVEALEALHGQGIELARDEAFGSVQAIVVDANGRPSAFSDPRSGGVAGIEGRPSPQPARPGEAAGTSDDRE